MLLALAGTLNLISSFNSCSRTVC